MKKPKCYFAEIFMDGRLLIFIDNLFPYIHYRRGRRLK